MNYVYIGTDQYGTEDMPLPFTTEEEALAWMKEHRSYGLDRYVNTGERVVREQYLFGEWVEEEIWWVGG